MFKPISLTMEAFLPSVQAKVFSHIPDLLFSNLIYLTFDVLLCYGPFVSKGNGKAGNDWCREMSR